MTRLPANAQMLDQAAKDLEISGPIYSAWVEDDGRTPPKLVINSREGTDTIPITTGAQIDTVPVHTTEPAVSDQAEQSSAGNGQADDPAPLGSSAGPDDFTDIDGVGPKYAAALHDAGLYTYDDLRDWRHALQDFVPPNTAAAIRKWLDQRLV